MSVHPIRGRGQRGRARSRGGFRPHRGGAMNGPSRGMVSGATEPAIGSQDSTPMLSGRTTPLQNGPRFRDFPGLSEELLRTLPFEHCTEVQAATLPTILARQDVLAQAKTGTGKTLAFLIPAIQRLLNSPLPPLNLTSILILSPTRELAQQIGVVAQTLLNPHAGKYAVRCLVGGTNVDRDIRDLKSLRADVLVATPGRLVDLLENGGVQPRFAQLGTLVLDEADRLLDQGFRRELEKILGSLPNRGSVSRQTLLFSATIPKEVHTIASLALSKDHKFITTLTEEDQNTHEHVRQESLVVAPSDILPAAVEVLRQAEENGRTGGGFKVLVFLPTARAAALFHDVFAAIPLSYPVWEIHSRLSQAKRTSTTEAFRKADRGVLFSSDVTARGIDIKDITMVMQVGLPSSADQYVHRLGRTARAGAEGHGILILGDFESHFLRDRAVQSFNLRPYPAIDMSDSRGVVEQALDTVPSEAKAQAYQAWLGYYNSSRGALKWSQADLIQHANAYALDSLRFGPEPPGMLAKTVGKMGLRGVPGLKVVKELPGKSGGGGRGGGSGDTGRGQGKRLREGDGSGSMLMEERGHGVNGDGNMMGGGGVRRGGNRGRASFGGGIAR